jgi:hypothetical protein
VYIDEDKDKVRGFLRGLHYLGTLSADEWWEVLDELGFGW